MYDRHMSPVLIVIAQEGFQDHELKGVRDAFLRDKKEVVLCSSRKGPCHGKFGSVESATMSMSEIDVRGYRCIVFIGGPGAAELASDGDALRIAREAASAAIPLGAICIAPTILAKARVLDGKKATVWPSQEAIDVLCRYGAVHTGESVTVDGIVVTGNGPDAAEEFGSALATLC